jgi:hypothetical protein
VARPQSVVGGRPIKIAFRISEAEAALVDGARGSLSRSDWFRERIPKTGTGLPAPRPRAIKDGHLHTWKRKGQYLDACAEPGCDVDRTHVPGTR